MKTVRALVIEDSKIMRQMLMQSLQKLDMAEFQFTEAGDGAEGLSKFDPAKIDIAFVDWNMPKMTGYDFVRKIRASKENDNVPLIMVTSEKGTGKVMDALDKAGAEAYIMKPFSPDDLRKELGKFIDQIGTEKSSGKGFLGKLIGR